MSDIMNFMNAAASKGDQVKDFVSVTHVDKTAGCAAVLDILRWVYGNYHEVFVGMDVDEANQHGRGLIDSGGIYDDFEEQFGSCRYPEMATINAALEWTAKCIVSGEKERVYFCYVLSPNVVVQPEENVEIHEGRKFNCFIPASEHRQHITVRRSYKHPKVELPILNRGVDLMEVALTTEKER